LSSVLLIALPVNAVFQILVSRILPALQHSPEVLQTIEKVVHELEAKYGVTVLTPETLGKMTNWGVAEITAMVGASLAGLLSLLVSCFILWFMLAEGKQMEGRFFEWLPLRPENEKYVREKLHSLVISNALGIPLMGVVQGLFGVAAYWAVGVQEPWLWFVITMLAGMLPIFGVALAYVPLAMLEMANGRPGIAAFILLYGFVVLGSVDNIARMWVLKKIGNAHPLVTLFGVIAGLQLFGFIGFVFGPIMVSMLILLLQLYGKEFSGKTL
jgi:predicted PurR-regulated permease PerM